MITWPDSFPKPTANFNIGVNTSAIRTKMDSGRFRQRKRFTINIRQIGVNWKVSDYEHGIFQSIYSNLLNNGADWFNISLPLGDGFKTYRCRFVADSYNAEYDDVMYWNIAAKLETEDQPEPYESEIIEGLVTIDLAIDDFESATDALHELVHETLPALE